MLEKLLLLSPRAHTASVKSAEKKKLLSHLMASLPQTETNTHLWSTSDVYDCVIQQDTSPVE